MYICLSFKLRREGSENKSRLSNCWKDGGVKGLTAFDTILKYALIRLEDGAQVMGV